MFDRIHVVDDVKHRLDQQHKKLRNRLVASGGDRNKFEHDFIYKRNNHQNRLISRPIDFVLARKPENRFQNWKHWKKLMPTTTSDEVCLQISFSTFIILLLKNRFSFIS